MTSKNEQEFINDHALRSTDVDRFDLDNFADEIARLTDKTTTPANIAIYAPWGSGKSSLGNRLGQKIKERGNAEFVLFDAFKYAETPLRRHFLSQIATSLRVTDRRYSDGLYRKRHTNTLKFPLMELGKLLLLFTGTFFGLLTILIFGGIGLEAQFPELVNSDRLPATDDLVGGAGLVAAVASALLAIGGRSFVSNVEQAAPSSEEEFDNLFKDLVAQVKSEKLVVFIDELDRCAPDEVVSTLETMRTFLEVPRCIFVVAADQAVLEQALSERARQSTPCTPDNPHYSAGSEYLDKIFQYQVSLPEKTSRRLSEFALSLVREREGIWQEIDQEMVISVLIPTHVRSPRRVKVLLNGFVIAYRLAKRRADTGVLSAPVDARAPELAKLVCLRHEFPTFARDLYNDWRLPEFVLMAARKESFEDVVGVHDRIKYRARQYARSELPVAVHLNHEEHNENEPDPADELDYADAQPPDHNGESDTARAHASHLIDYLYKTEFIITPQRDLVYLEGAGAIFGMDSELADQIEDAAVNGRTAAAAKLISSMGDDHTVSGLRFLATVVREAAVGIEGSNSVSSLLRILGDVDQNSVGPVVDEIADAVAVHSLRHKLRTHDQLGALRLGLWSSRDTGRSLIFEVLRNSNFSNDLELTAEIVRNTPEVAAVEGTLKYLGRLIAYHIEYGDCQTVADGLSRTEPNRAISLLNEAVKDLKRRQSNWDEDNEPEPPTAETFTANTSLLMESLLAVDAPTLAVPVAELLLDVGDEAGFSEFDRSVEALAPIRKVSLVEKMLPAMEQLSMDRWSAWLKAVEWGDAQIDVARGEVMSLLTVLANGALEEADSDPDAVAVTDLHNAADGLHCSFASTEEYAHAGKTVLSLLEQASSEDELLKQAIILKILHIFSDVGSVQVSALCDAAAQTFTQQISQNLTNDRLVKASEEHHRTWLPHIGRTLSASRLDELRQALADSPWLSDVDAKALWIRLIADAVENGHSPADPIDANEMKGYINRDPSRMEYAVADWLRVLRPQPSGAKPAIQAYAYRPVSSALINSIRNYLDALDPRVRHEVLQPIVASARIKLPTEQFVRGIGFGKGHEVEVARDMVEEFGKATNNEQRGRILGMWKLLGPSNESARAILVKQIYIPMLKLGRQAFEEAFRGLGLAVPPPHGTKIELVNEFQSKAKEYNIKKKVGRALEDANLIKKKKRWWAKNHE